MKPELQRLNRQNQSSAGGDCLPEENSPRPSQPPTNHGKRLRRRKLTISQKYGATKMIDEKEKDENDEQPKDPGNPQPNDPTPADETNPGDVEGPGKGGGGG